MFFDAMSTRMFEKMADEKLSAFHETPNHGFYGPEKVQNYEKERRKEKKRKRRGKKEHATFYFILQL